MHRRHCYQSTFRWVAVGRRFPRRVLHFSFPEKRTSERGSVDICTFISVTAAQCVATAMRDDAPCVRVSMRRGVQLVKGLTGATRCRIIWFLLVKFVSHLLRSISGSGNTFKVAYKLQEEHRDVFFFFIYIYLCPDTCLSATITYGCFSSYTRLFFLSLFLSFFLSRRNRQEREPSGISHRSAG